jgi:hypothetical protein
MTILAFAHGTKRIGIAVNVLNFILMLLVFTGNTRAQEKSSLPPSGVTTNNNSRAETEETNAPTDLVGGSSGDVSQVPVDLHPFQLTLPRAHLLGDWFGFRTNLEDQGITPTLTFVTDLAGNPVGGRSQGFTEADNLGLDLLFDLDKLVDL